MRSRRGVWKFDLRPSAFYLSMLLYSAMKWIRRLRTIGKVGVRWVYPEWCGVCRIHLALTEDRVCHECRNEMTALKEPLCYRCGVELPPYSGKGNRCSACQRTRMEFDSVHAPYRYEGKVRKLLHAVKFRREYWLLDGFKRTIAETLEGIEMPDCIIPVPLNKYSLKERSFNQAGIMAGIIQNILEVNMINNVLLRKGKRLPQSHLSRRERFNNLEHAFEVKHSESIQGKHILLVDDVVTTGATAHACANQLKQAGAVEVTVFSLARTPIRL